MLLRTFVMAFALAAGPVYADPSRFHPGPVIAEYGRIADVPGAEVLPDGAAFKVAFDVSEAGQAGAVNRNLDSAARFLNLHAAAGVPQEHMELAIVVHGPAARDLLANPDNANAGLIAALITHGVKIYLCGQTAASMDIGAEDLLPGVRMALSAMTANALLQQQGYTLNPF